MSNELPKTGSIESTAVTVSAAGFRNCSVSFDEGSATAGTVTMTIKAPGMDDELTPSDNVYTVGTPSQLILEGADMTDLILTPASVDAEMNYRVLFWN